MATDAMEPDVYSAPPPEAAAALGSPPDASPLPATSAAPPVSPVVVQPPVQQQQPGPDNSHGVLSKILGAVGDVLGGPKSVSTVDPNTGDIVQHQLSGRERTANTIAMYLRGVGAGLAAHGPGAVGQAAILGSRAEQQHQERIQSENQQQSQNIRQRLSDTAARTHLAQLNAESGWRMIREQTEIDTATADKLEKYRQLVASNPTNKDYGTYKSFDDFIAANKQLQQNGVDLVKLHAEGHIATVPITEGGKVTGVRVFQVNPEWAAMRNEQPITFPYPTGKINADGSPEMGQTTIPSGAITNETALQFLGKLGNDALGAQEKAATTTAKKQDVKESQELLPSKKAQAGAAAALSTAEAGKLKEETKQLQQFDQQTSPAGEPLGLPGDDRKSYGARRDKFNKEYVEGIRKTEQGYRQFQEVLDDVRAGKDLTGAQSVVALFNAIGLSAKPLKGQGMRINNNTVSEHEFARSLPESLRQKLLSYKTGAIITPNQIKDYASIAMRSRANELIAAGQEARRQGIPADFLPTAQLKNGQRPVVDPETAYIYSQVYGGDVQKAHNALLAAGYAP